MTKKKIRLSLNRKNYRNKKNSKDKNKKPNSIMSQNQYKYLQSKFKLKELRIILHDITADNRIMSLRKPSINKNDGSMEAINEYEKYNSKEIYSRDKEFSVNDILNIEYPNVISSAIPIRKHDKEERIIEKQNIDNNFDIQAKLLNAKGQETYFHKYIESLSSADTNSNRKEKEYKVTNDVVSLQKSGNTDFPGIFAFQLEKQNKSFNEQNEETFVMTRDLMETRYSIVQTNEKLPNETQNILINQNDINKVYNQNTLEGRNLPKITEDKILAKNTILLKTVDNMEIPNNLQHTAYYTNVVLQSENKECFSFGKHSRVADLTEHNLHKFTENYDRSFVSQKNIISLNTTKNVENSPNSNSTEILLKTNKDNLQVPYRKRGWISSKASVDLDKTGGKRVKLNRKCIQDKNCTATTNSIACPSDDKSSTLFFKSHSININNDRPQNRDDCLTLYSNNGNSLYTIQLVPEATKADFDNIPRSTHAVEKSLYSNLQTIFNEENDLLTEIYHQNIEEIFDSNLSISQILGCNTQLDPQNQVESRINDNRNDGHDYGGDYDVGHKNYGGGDDIDRKNYSGGDDIDRKDDGTGDDIDRKEDGAGDEVDRRSDGAGDNVDHKNDDGGDDVDRRNGDGSDDIDRRNDDGGEDAGHMSDGDVDDVEHKDDEAIDVISSDGGCDNSSEDSDDDSNCNEDSGDGSNCNNDEDDEDDDCISLFTDSLLSVDAMPVPCKENKKKETGNNYTMTGNTLDKYFEQNILECNKEFDMFEEHNTLKDKSFQKVNPAKCEEIKQNRISALQRLSLNVESTNSVNSRAINNNNGLCPNQNYNKHNENNCPDEDAMTCTKEIDTITCQALCKGFCFPTMRHGDCNRTPCYFNHDLQILITNIIHKYKQYLVSIIHYMYSTKYYYCLKVLYLQCLQDCNVDCIMDLFNKLYSIQYAYLDIVYVTVKTLMHKGMSPKDVVDSLCKILISTDKCTPQYIINGIKDNIEVGEYWNTLRNLVTHIKPTKEVIESILNECLTTREHIQDVYINLIKGLHPEELNQLNRDLMSSFNNLLKHESEKIPDKTSPKLVNSSDGSSTQSYVLQSISDLPEPQSQYRDRFWKLYLMIYNIKEALAHEDYDYIISILNEYEEDTLFSRCCFRMLTAEIKHSEYHISKIIEHAVQIGASSILYKVLLDIATYVLMKLTIESAWTIAYKLLKTIQIYNLQNSAAFIILSAEIYLANKRAIKALMLIKQSNIISTNRDKWNVASNEQDYNPRTNIINILLDVLCIKSPEHAFFIFQFLTKDQGNNFRPIDLTYYVDKLMLKLLIEREIDLIVKMGYMIIEYNFTFFNVTICRAAIASIVHIDMVLAKQLYQYASGLGIYRTIELLPVIHVIINVDWVEEEVYLTFWDLFQRLVMDIGHSIDHLTPAQLSIYIIFQFVPTEAHLYCENLDDQQKKKIQISKNLVRQVLHSRFEPSILLSKKKVNGTIMKLQNKVVINHLKAMYKSYIE